MKFKQIILYDEPAVPEIDITSLVSFLKQTIPVEVIVKNNFFENFSTSQIRMISETRIFDTKKTFKPHLPVRPELELEEQFCKNSKVMEQTKKPEEANNISEVVMYDGFELQKILRECMSDFDNKTLHIILTNRFTCTYDETDARYHGRAVICSNPAIISTTGVIEAPAKSRQFYLEAMANKAQKLGIASVKAKHKGEFLEYHDERLSKIIEGYLLQVIFYILTGESFCDYLDCRLNNAHWQRDLLYSQIEIRKLCNKHQEILDSLR